MSSAEYTVERMELASQSPVEERIAGLMALFPEAVREGRIDVEVLQRSLGEWVDPGKERFGLTWPGKAACMKLIQQPSVGTLLPDRAGSVDFDTTGNVIIEGDNLEVLKLLQRAYHGKVKLIYIDPPYNTGNDFIYRDDFRMAKGDYELVEGVRAADGTRLVTTGTHLMTNSGASGRLHTDWLNMMYPRLYLARNLLRDDGVIFVSIDDHEVHNLRRLMDELFGEENFIATVIWQKVYSPKNTAMHLSEDHDYAVLYARNAGTWRPTLLPRSDEANARYDNPDEDLRGPWKPGDLTARNYYSKGQYAIRCPSGRVIEGPPTGTYWRVSEEQLKQLDADGRIWWGEHGNNAPAVKRFLSEVKQGVTPQTLWQYKDVGHTQEAKQELVSLVAFSNTENVFNTVKPVRLIQRMLQIATSAKTDDVVLDFFAGSMTTGHAVLKQNAEDGGNRRFICVQFPEPLPSPEPGLATIADIGRQRLRSAGRTLASERNGGAALDVGFRSFKLAESNFRPWVGDAAPPDEPRQPSLLPVAEQIELFTENLVPGRTPEDLLTEVLLKAGYELTTPVAWLELAGNRVASVAEGGLFVCLDPSISLACIEEIARHTPPFNVVCLEAGFEGDDQRKVNALQLLRTRARNAGTTIEFKVV